MIQNIPRTSEYPTYNTVVEAFVKTARTKRFHEDMDWSNLLTPLFNLHECSEDVKRTLAHLNIEQPWWLYLRLQFQGHTDDLAKLDEIQSNQLEINDFK